MTSELNEAIVSDAGRPPIAIQRRDNGAYWIHAPKTIVALDADEAQKLAAFITGKAPIERYPVTTPAKARFEQLDDWRRSPTHDRVVVGLITPCVDNLRGSWILHLGVCQGGLRVHAFDYR
jgi:hypothetical protein